MILQQLSDFINTFVRKMTGHPSIAFVGLGSMGYGMASNLFKSGFDVIGYDVYQPAMERFASTGGKCARTPAIAVAKSEFFICMVASSTQANPLLFDKEDGAVVAMPRNATILMCSTVAPAYIEEIQRTLAEVGRSDICLIDCPVSGGPGRAANGTLSIFSSGSDDHMEHARKILECMSSNLYRIPGGLGGGSRAKLIHQIFAGVNIAMASEAMGLAAQAGLDLAKTFHELRASEASSWMFENRVPHILNPDLGPYSAMTIITKDVGIITSTGRLLNFPLPMISSAEQLYLMAITKGLHREDDCALIRLYLPDGSNSTDSSGFAPKPAEGFSISASEIGDLMIGVHTAALAEAMSFCDRLGIDSTLMHDIVAQAAGTSKAFVKVFKQMQATKWSLIACPEVDDAMRRAVSHLCSKFTLAELDY